MSPTKQFDAARVAECMWMELAYARLLAKGLDELEYPVIPHALFSRSASLNFEPHHEKRIVCACVRAIRIEMFRQDGARNLR